MSDAEGRLNLYKRFTPIQMLLVVIALVLVACGGNSSPTATTEPTPAQRSAAVDPSPAEDPTAVPRIAESGATAAKPDGTDATNPPSSAVVTRTPTQRNGAEPTRGKDSPTLTQASAPPVEPTGAPATKTPLRIFTPTPAASQFGEPVRFKIEKIAVDAVVEHVGLTEPDEDGRRAMDVPKGWNNVAWYKLGYLPGEKGNSVVAGHYDSPTDAAVFYRLGELTEGDIVAVSDDKGRTLQFKVTRTESFTNENAPLFEIFGPTSKKRLNLITCDGDWTGEEYTNKLVVFTELVEE